MHISNTKCYRRLSMGGEDEGQSEVYTLYIIGTEVLSFRYHMLLDYKLLTDAIEGFDRIVSRLGRNGLLAVVKEELSNLLIPQSRHEVQVVQLFINYIEKENNVKYI